MGYAPKNLGIVICAVLRACTMSESTNEGNMRTKGVSDAIRDGAATIIRAAIGVLGGSSTVSGIAFATET